MNIEQTTWTTSHGWARSQGGLDATAQWVLAFGAPAALEDPEVMRTLRSRYPRAHVMGCSTAGEIHGTEVRDDSLVATAVHFEHTDIQVARASVADAESSHDAGACVAAELAREGLTHVMVFADGLNVNGTALAHGLRAQLPDRVAVTGGLAGDADRFQRTLVCLDGDVMPNMVAAIGFYGDRLRVGHGSLGGWDSFGPQRLITRSHGNVLYELDGQPALELYKRYLGEHAAGLPASALLFPLALSGEGIQDSVVRTILSVDEENGSMTFAGDMPTGAYARLMKANFDRLIDGAAEAARAGLHRLDSFAPSLAVLISCVGRKLVLKQRVEEEVESVRDVLGKQAMLAGFYSYGEICPHGAVTRCELHNQTMTVTTFAEQ